MVNEKTARNSLAVGDGPEIKDLDTRLTSLVEVADHRFVSRGSGQIIEGKPSFLCVNESTVSMWLYGLPMSFMLWHEVGFTHL